MARVGRLLFGVMVTVFGCSAAPRGNPRAKVDVSAMREAMRAAASEERTSDYASSAAYRHFLRSRLHHHEGRHLEAARELELAIASDEGDPMLLTSLAEEYARTSDLPRAERLLRRVLDRKPKYGPAQLLVGRLLLEQGRYPKARLHLRRAIELAPKDPEAYLVLAQLELEESRPDAAMALARALGRALPGEPIAYKRLGLAFADRGDLPRALKMLEAAAERDSGDFEVEMTLASVYEAQNNLALAEKAYEKALLRDPENQAALLAAGKVALRSGAASRAQAYFRQLRAQTDDPELAVKVAFAYLSAGEMALAVETLDVARKTSKEPRISFYAALVHERSRRLLEAARAYGEVPEGTELFNEARVRQATCLSMAGRHAKALGLLKGALESSPDQLMLYPAYARALERSGAFAQAEKFLLAAINRFGETELVDALSDAYERQARADDAVKLLRRQLEQHPSDESLLFSLGAVYERQGNVKAALAQMRQILALNPNNAAAHNFIGYTLAERGESLDEAEVSIKRAVALRPESGAYLDSLGWLYFRKGELDRAVATLERASALAPSEPIIREHLGDAYRSARRTREAADAYSHALKSLHEIGEPEQHDALRRTLESKLKALSTETSTR